VHKCLVPKKKLQRYGGDRGNTQCSEEKSRAKELDVPKGVGEWDEMKKSSVLNPRVEIDLNEIPELRKHSG